MCYKSATVALFFPFWPRLESNPTPGWHKTIRKIHTRRSRVMPFMSKVVLMKSENQMHYWFSVFSPLVELHSCFLHRFVESLVFTRQILSFVYIGVKWSFLKDWWMMPLESRIEVSVSPEIVYVMREIMFEITLQLGFLRSWPPVSLLYRSIPAATGRR